MRGAIRLYPALAGLQRAGENFLSRLEFGQEDSPAGVLEQHRDRHADFHPLDRAADDVAANPRALLEVDPGGDVGDVLLEAAERAADDLADDGEREDFAAAAQLRPFKLA